MRILHLMGIGKAKVTVIISIWGIVMLLLMGAAYKARSPALYKDIPLDFQNASVIKDPQAVYAAYDSSASNCFIAAGIYLATFVFGLWQWRIGQTMEKYTVR